MKKVAIISPINRIIIDGQSIRSLEALYLKKELENNNYNVFFISKKIKENDLCYLDYNNFNNLNEFDSIYIHNFNTNFFGGLITNYTLKMLDLISNFNGEIFYYITDPKLKYKNIAEDILKRNSIKFESDVDINHIKNLKQKLDFIQLRMKILFSGYNYKPIYGLENENCIYINIFKKIAIDLLNNKKIDIFSTIEDELNIEYDICYFGDNRGTYRNNKIKTFLDSNYIKSFLIGCELNLKNNFLHKKVMHSQLNNLVKKCHSSLVIGDKEHENAFDTMRFYENIIFEVISFIDINYDINKELFKNKELKSFNYITSQNDLIYKLQKIKNDNEFKKHIIKLQLEELINNK